MQVGSTQQAVQAYNRVLQANKGMPASSAMEVAKQSVKMSQIAGAIDNVTLSSSKNLFSAVVTDVVKKQTQKIKKAERTIRSSITPDSKGVPDGGDLISVMAAVNESQMALETIVTIRDKFVSAYETILKMPI